MGIFFHLSFFQKKEGKHTQKKHEPWKKEEKRRCLMCYRDESMSHHTDWTSHRLCYYGADTGLQLKLRDHCHKCMQTRQCRQAYWLVWQHCPVTTYRATLPLWPLPPPLLYSHACVYVTLFTSFSLLPHLLSFPTISHYYLFTTF